MPQIYFSTLSTTLGAAGSVKTQREIDLDLNLSLSRAAQKSGTKICVSARSSAIAKLPYPKMKGELEDAVQELGFETTVLLEIGIDCGEERGAIVVSGSGLRGMWQAQWGG